MIHAVQMVPRAEGFKYVGTDNTELVYNYLARNRIEVR